MKPDSASIEHALTDVAGARTDIAERKPIHRRGRPLSTLWRVFTVNALVFGFAVFVLIRACVAGGARSERVCRIFRTACLCRPCR